MSFSEGEAPKELRTTPWGVLPSWFDEKLQTETNNAAWAGRAETWRTEEEAPRSMQDFVQQYCGPNNKVLDQGCGNGRALLLLAKNGADAYGIDVSSEMGQIAQKRLSEAGFDPRVFQRDFYHLDFPDNTFDAAISSQTMQLPGCWAKIKEAFDLLVRTMKPGGHLYFRVRSVNSPDLPNCQYFEDQYGADDELIERKGTNIRNRRSRDDINGQFRHNYSREEIEFLASKYGMEIVGDIQEEWNETWVKPNRPHELGTNQWIAVMRKKTG